MRIIEELKIWWKQASPANRAAIILGALAAAGTLALLLARKPWQWSPSPGRSMRIADYVRIYSWWAGAANCLLLAALAACARSWMRASHGGMFRPVAAVLPALVLAADNRGDASLRLVRRTAPPSKLLG